MLNEEMMSGLETIESTITEIDSVDNYTEMRCDCTNGCTDNCYDCAKDSGNQW